MTVTVHLPLKSEELYLVREVLRAFAEGKPQPTFYWHMTEQERARTLAERIDRLAQNANERDENG